MMRSLSRGTRPRPCPCLRTPPSAAWRRWCRKRPGRAATCLPLRRSGQAPSTPGGSRSAPCAQIGGASRRIGPFTSERARTLCQPPSGGPGLSCGTLAQGRRPSSSCPSPSRGGASPEGGSLGPEAAQSSSDAPAQADLPLRVPPDGTPAGSDGNRPGTDTHGDAGGYTGRPAPRGGPHGNGRARARWAGEAPIPTQQPPITAPDHSLRPPFRDMVLPIAAVRKPRGGLTDGVELPAVVGVPPPLSAPIER